MSRFVSRRSARELDRLARAAHRFHRYAHHPLCTQYAAEVIRVGRKARICKGCTLSILGGGLGLFLTFSLQPSAAVCFAAIAVATVLCVMSTLGRWPKELSRGIPALLVGFGTGTLQSLPLAVAMGVAFLWLYRRRGPYRNPCRSCPERTKAICSGYLGIARRERAFARLATARLRPSMGVMKPI